VRPYYYRNGERTLPGVLRYSTVPTSVLVEVANLNNRADRMAMLSADSRQRVARALATALDGLRAQRTAPIVARKGS
jgi:N-acetylmuramoyl-L-alanine amidase